ncbi:hypothetical protein AB0M95_24570 [Sphaerisporangium sp. NPDC051017]
MLAAVMEACPDGVEDLADADIQASSASHQAYAADPHRNGLWR